MDELPIDRSVKKLRALTLSLIFSGALNIGLIATGVWSYCQENTSDVAIRPLIREKSGQETSTDRFLSHIDKLSFHELVSYLTNCDPLDDGYLKRDLALASLVAFHHFHLEKALSGVSIQRRTIPLGKDLKIEVFPGLTNDHFAAVIRFAYEEKWPLTAEGLYKLLKKWPLKKDPSLEQAFFATSEFHALQVLFQKTDPSSLLNLVCEGSFDLLDHFSREQAQLLDLSVERRRSLLLSYLAAQSKTAAYLLLSTDFSYLAKRLEDQGIIGLVLLLDQKTPESERLCIELLKSPRSDAVWMSAAKALYAYAGEAIPSPLDLQEAIHRFAPGASPQAPAQKPALLVSEKPIVTVVEPPKFRQHIVQDGDSLWKIARQYNVKVDDLVKLNEMEKDRLYPGMTLRIP